MISYNVYFTPKDTIPEPEALEIVHSFMRGLDAKGMITAYRVLRINNKVNFDQLPKYQLIVDYETEEQSTRTFDFIKNGEATKEPHKSLMTMTKEFKISFSEDV
jgi:hypothetical protein